MGRIGWESPKTKVCFPSLAACRVFSVTRAGFSSIILAALARFLKVAVSPRALSSAARPAWRASTT